MIEILLCDGCGRDTVNEGGFCNRCIPQIDRYWDMGEAYTSARLDSLPPLLDTLNGHRRPRVFVSCPISRGDAEVNFKRACAAQHDLILHGYAPLNPALCMRLPGNELIEHDQWMEVSLPWVEASDAVLRVSGYSRGADEETAHAEFFSIPVFYSIDEIDLHFWDEGD